MLEKQLRPASEQRLENEVVNGITTHLICILLAEDYARKLVLAEHFFGKLQSKLFKETQTIQTTVNRIHEDLRKGESWWTAVLYFFSCTVGRAVVDGLLSQPNVRLEVLTLVACIQPYADKFTWPEPEESNQQKR